jgi:hypothetical protein
MQVTVPSAFSPAYFVPSGHPHALSTLQETALIPGCPAQHFWAVKPAQVLELEVIDASVTGTLVLPASSPRVGRRAGLLGKKRERLRQMMPTLQIALAASLGGRSASGDWCPHSVEIDDLVAGTP